MEPESTITVTCVPNEKEVGEVVADDIAEFDAWFTAKGNDPLITFEIAILKTYLGYKLGVAK